MRYVNRETGSTGKWHLFLTKVPIGAGQAFTLAFLSKLLFNRDFIWQTTFGSGWTVTKYSTGVLHSPVVHEWDLLRVRNFQYAAQK